MFCLNHFTFLDICYRSCNFNNSVVAAGTDPITLKCLLQKLFPVSGNRTKIFNLTRRQFTIIPDHPSLIVTSFGFCITFSLRLLHPLHNFSQFFRRFPSFSISGQCLITKCRYLHAQIHTVQKRLTDFIQVTKHPLHGAGATVHIRIVPARTRIHGTHKHKVRRKYVSAPCSGYCNLPFLQRLAQNLNCMPGYLCQLIQK